MKKFILITVAFILLLSLTFTFQTSVFGQRIVSVYPAGGQKGTSFEVIVAGQQVMRARQVTISGEGVQAEIIGGGSGFRLNEANERFVITQEFIKAIKRVYGEKEFPRLVASAKPKDADELVKLENILKRRIWIDRLSSDYRFENEQEEKLFLQRFYYEYYMPRPDRFLQNLMGNLLLIRVTVAPNAQTGWRKLFISSQQGISNEVPFQISSVREVSEIEPNDPGDKNSLFMNFKRNKSNNPRGNEQFKNFFQELPAQDLPVIFNGQIRAGDADHFQFNAEKGQKLVLACWGRFLSPYLADAVPGWFAPVITLLDPEGKKIKTADSWRFDPDPILLFEVPKSGVYSVDIQDSLFRGRDDFVYRLAIGSFPFITSTSALGFSESQKKITLFGWNLPVSSVTPSDCRSPQKSGAPLVIDRLGDRDLLYPLVLANDDLPVISEQNAPKILTIPTVIDGKISANHETDEFSFKGNAGDEIVLDLSAIRWGSALDAKIELYDSRKNLIAENDDRADEKGPNIGLETHHADPYIHCRLDRDDLYTVRVYNLLDQGGREYGYRLRISEPIPDFEVYAFPSVIRFRSANEVLQLVAIRKDGFNGPIAINETELKTKRSDDTLKLNISGAALAEGIERALCVLNAEGMSKNVVPCNLTASAMIRGKKVTHRVIPADNLEQAFIYFHLMPRDKFFIQKTYRSMPSVIADPYKKITFKNGSAELSFALAERGILRNYLQQKELHLRQKDQIPKAQNKEASNEIPQFEFSVIEPKNIAVDRWEIKDDQIQFKLKLTNSDEEGAALLPKANIVIGLMMPQLASKDPTKKRTTAIREYLPAAAYEIIK